MTFLVFSSSSFIGRSLPVEPFSFTGAIGISDGCCFGAIVAIMLGRFVFMPFSGYLVISIYIYCYSLIYLYRYCAICLLLYCMLAAWWYYFLYIYILFLSLTSTFFSPNVRTTQTGIKFYNSFHCSVIHVALML